MPVFGPVPSRRLGRSLGVNNIPYKICTYACVYCQLGNTLRMDINRHGFYEPEKIYKEVEKKIKVEKLDYITFVPDGEPTLDLNLGKEARMLKDFSYPLAILTNSSLVWREDVQNDLMEFDYISFKIDAVSYELWKKVDRPHKSLSLQKILDSLLNFRDNFGGRIVTETMLISGVDYGEEIVKIADYLASLKPEIAYIAIPTRPPAEKWVLPASEELITEAYHVFSQKLNRVEYLIGYEGSNFAASGNFEEDILSITAVHPMREEAVIELMRKDGASPKILERLISEDKIRKIDFSGHAYYLRKFKVER
ncbi:radical SAM protein [Euryarchaeota archaeon ex4484_178]|nr:MAG: radical SAM protein [Euryarchaeota archaeon ex4484_178]